MDLSCSTNLLHDHNEVNYSGQKYFVFVYSGCYTRNTTELGAYKHPKFIYCSSGGWEI